MDYLQVWFGIGCDVPSCTLPPARRLKPQASGLPGRPTPAHAATPVAFVCVAGGFSPTGRGALHDGTSHASALAIPG
ncbi:MAG: hypothetical protein ACUVS4_11940 [Chloroflexaceae bacterium]